MIKLNNNPFVEEVKSVIESYVVMLNLSHDSQFTVRISENKFKSLFQHGYEFTVEEKNGRTYIMRVFIYDDNSMRIVLDKNRFRSGIYFNSKLKKLNISTIHELANPEKTYWEIYAYTTDDLQDIIKVINKKMNW